MARIPTPTSTGQDAKKGSERQIASDNAGTLTSMGTVGAEFEAAPFDRVSGNARGTSLHAGAPDNSGPDPSLPGSVPLTAHHFMAANPAKGNSPKRSAGKTTGTDEATRRKLSEAGA